MPTYAMKAEIGQKVWVVDLDARSDSPMVVGEPCQDCDGQGFLFKTNRPGSDKVECYRCNGDGTDCGSFIAYSVFEDFVSSISIDRKSTEYYLTNKGKWYDENVLFLSMSDAEQKADELNNEFLEDNPKCRIMKRPSLD
jgi:hypothetical protein